MKTLNTDKISNKLDNPAKVNQSKMMKRGPQPMVDFDVSDISSDEEDKKPTKISGNKPILNSDNLIEIQVIDPVSKKRESFKCKKGLLLKEMKFFDLYNKEAQKSS